jgi:hypothetical protein
MLSSSRLSPLSADTNGHFSHTAFPLLCRLFWMRVRLVRKLADQIDGIDLSAFNVGEILNMPRGSARMLIAEQWAVPLDPPHGHGHQTAASKRLFRGPPSAQSNHAPQCDAAADQPHRRKRRT